MGIFSKLFGSYSTRELARIEPMKQKVLALDEEYTALSDAELKGKNLNICHYGSDFANSRSYTLKNGQLKINYRLDYYRNAKTGYAYCYYKNSKKVSYDAYKKAVKSFWTGKKVTFAKIN